MENQINAAIAAAKKAVSDAQAQYGNDRGCCGFGWVEIPDGRSQLVRTMKKMGVGRKHWKKGWTVWNPGESNWQNVDVNVAGAHAFAACFPGEAFACSRLD